MRFVHFSCMSTLRSDVALYKANADAMQRTSYASENQHYNMSTSVESQRLRCDVCQKMFSSRSNLKRHIKLHRASDRGQLKMKMKMEIRLVRCERTAASDTGDVLNVKSLALPLTNGDVMLLFLCLVEMPEKTFSSVRLCLVEMPEKTFSSVRLYLHELSSSEVDGFTRPFLVLMFDRWEFLDKVVNNCCILPGVLLRTRIEKVLLAVDVKQCVSRARDYLVLGVVKAKHSVILFRERILAWDQMPVQPI
jgi:hypothetical protein